jgi:hypothetical protein
MAEIPDNRELSSAERQLTRWLLERGGPEAAVLLDQVDQVRVVSCCACGCASVNFEFEGQGWGTPGGMTVHADHEWRDADGRLFGIFVFSKSGCLAGLEVWSVDGSAVPRELPEPHTLNRRLVG